MTTTPPASTAGPARHRASSLSIALAIPRFGSLSLSPSTSQTPSAAGSGIASGGPTAAGGAAGVQAEEYKRAFHHARSASAGGAANLGSAGPGGAMAIPSYASHGHSEQEFLCEADEHPSEGTTALGIFMGSLGGREGMSTSQSPAVTAAATTLFSNGARWGWPSPPASSSSSSPPRSISNGLKGPADDLVALPPSPPTSEFGSLPPTRSSSISVSASVPTSSTGHSRRASATLGGVSFATPSSPVTLFSSGSSSGKALSSQGGPSKVTAGMVPLSRVRSAGAAAPSSSVSKAGEGFGIFRRLSVGGFGTRPKPPSPPAPEAPPLPSHRSTTQPVSSSASSIPTSPPTGDRDRSRRASTNTTRPKRRISPMGERMLRGGLDH